MVIISDPISQTCSLLLLLLLLYDKWVAIIVYIFLIIKRRSKFIYFLELYHISGRRNGQLWNTWSSCLCGGTFPYSILRPAVPHSWPVRGSATWRPKGKIKHVRQETISAGALTNCNITLQLPGTQWTLHLPVVTLLPDHIAPLLSSLASPANCGVTQCFHHRPPGMSKFEHQQASTSNLWNI